MNFPSKRMARSAPLALLTLLTLLAAASQAAEPQSTAAPVAAVAQAQALRAVRDPETGKMRLPTPAEAAQMAAQERAERGARGLPEVDAATNVQVFRHVNGMLSAKLGPEHLVTITARRGPDGKLVRAHSNPAYEHPTAAKQPAATE